MNVKNPENDLNAFRPILDLFNLRILDTGHFYKSFWLLQSSHSLRKVLQFSSGSKELKPKIGYLTSQNFTFIKLAGFDT